MYVIVEYGIYAVYSVGQKLSQVRPFRLEEIKPE
jgi:hypothetical protein